MNKNSRNGIHAQRLKQIRGFINFDFDLRKPLTKYQKSKVKKYYDEVNALTARPYQVYRPRTKARLKPAQKFAQHEKQLPGLKVAFIPTDGKHKSKVRFNKDGEISVTSEHVSTRLIELDTEALLKDPIKHIESKIENRMENSFTVLAGRYEIPVGHDKSSLPGFVANLTNKYSNDEANNYFGNWLHGIAAHHFTGQADIGEYLAEKQLNKNKMHRKRRNKKQRQYRRKLKGAK